MLLHAWILLANRVSAGPIAASGGVAATLPFDQADGHRCFLYCSWQRIYLTSSIFLDWGSAAHLQPDCDLALPVLRIAYDGLDLARSALSSVFSQIACVAPPLARDWHLVDACHPAR